MRAAFLPLCAVGLPTRRCVALMELPSPGSMLAFKTKRGRLGIILVLVAALLAVAWTPAARHVRAASLLLRFSTPEEAKGLARALAVPVDEADATYHDTAFEGGMVVRARLYSPRGSADPPGIVLVHGVHRRGIDEPRLIRFAKAIAGAGVRVLTP